MRNVAYGARHLWAAMFSAYVNRDRHSKRVNQWAEINFHPSLQLIYRLSSPFLFPQIKEESNVLQDGTLIDLCGATLLWRSAEGLQNSPVSCVASLHPMPFSSSLTDFFFVFRFTFADKTWFREIGWRNQRWPTAVSRWPQYISYPPKSDSRRARKSAIRLS